MLSQETADLSYISYIKYYILMSHWCLNVYTETNAAVPDLAWGLLALSLHKYALLVKAYLV